MFSLILKQTFRRLFYFLKSKLNKCILYYKGFQLFKNLKKKKITGNKPIVYFKDISDDRFNRYLFTLAYALHKHGYNIVFEKNLIFLGKLSKYSKIIFDFPNSFMYNLKNEKPDLVFTTQKNNNGIYLNPDYFSEASLNVYYLPMLMHPLMYVRQYAFESIPIKDRINSICFFGANDGEYAGLNTSFKLLSRQELIQIVSTTQYYFEPATISDLKSVTHKQIIIILRKNFSIPMKSLRDELSKYDFFLACPGVRMPLSHNLVEALSVGTIPIIQRNYANQLKPKLSENEAIIYDSEIDLLAKLEGIFEMSNEHKKRLSDNGLQYYQNYLVPEAIIAGLRDIKELRILAGNAGQISVGLFEKNEITSL